MKRFSVRLPEGLAAEIEAEARRRGLSNADVIRERLTGGARPSSLVAIADLIGSVDGLPSDLSARAKRYLRSTGPK
jgi:hypothetical protein